MKRRIACLWFPNWSLQQITVARPELNRWPILVATEQAGRGESVWTCNGLARRHGVRPGMPLCEARSLVQHCRRVHLEKHPPAANRRALKQLAIRYERFSPCVGLEEAEHPECLLLDVTGLADLFSSEASLANQIDRDAATRGFLGHVAIGDSVGAAWAAAHYLAKPEKPVVMPAGSLAGLLSLSLEGLRLPETDIKIFRHLGITSIRQVLGLKRASLASRFSPQTLLRLRQFTGKQTEVIVSCRPLPIFQASFTLEQGTGSLEILQCIWDRLLFQLNRQLHERYQAVRTIRCDLTTDANTLHTTVIGLCHPVTDLRPVGELLILKLGECRVDRPIVTVQLEATETCPVQWHQEGLLTGQSLRATRQLHSLLDRLSSRLGAEAVIRPALVPDPLPERAVEKIPVTSPSQSRRYQPPNQLLALDRLTGLLPIPKPVEVVAAVPDGPPAVMFWEGRGLVIAQQWGPERIEAGWESGSYARRDYYQIETAEGKRYWLFRRLADGHWFLHGMLL